MEAIQDVFYEDEEEEEGRSGTTSSGSPDSGSSSPCSSSKSLEQSARPRSPTPTAEPVAVTQEKNVQGTPDIVQARLSATIDSPDIAATQKRLMAAIVAEHANATREHCKQLQGSRSDLERQGKMVTGLCLQAIDGRSVRQVFKASKMQTDADGFERRLPLGKHEFTQSTNVTVVFDLQSPLNEADTPEKTEDLEDMSFGMEDNSTTARPWNPSTSAPPPPEPADLDLAEVLARLGIKKSFEARLLKSDNPKMQFKLETRYDNAALDVQEAQGAKWAIIKSLDDITYRRQKAAVEGLGTLSPGKSLEAADDEVRVRKLLTYDPLSRVDAPVSQAGDSPQEAAAKRVSWMTDAALQEVHSLLNQDSGLNDKQRRYMMAAAKRTITLLKGPPGTGKSRTLTAMIKVMCRVFLDQSNESSERSGFVLPTSAPLIQWGPSEVQKWLESLVVQEEGENDATLPLTRVPGVTPKIKQCLMDALEGYTGRMLKGLKESTLRSAIKDMLLDKDKGLDEEEAAGAAAASTPLLLKLRERVLQPSQGSASKPHKVSDDRQMRIVVAADSNVAVNNLLRLLDGDPDFKARGYNIIRLGLTDELRDESEPVDGNLAELYGIEHRRKGHRLQAVHEWIIDALKGKGDKLNIRFAEEVENTILVFAEQVNSEAEKEPGLSNLVRKELKDLADRLEHDVALRAKSAIAAATDATGKGSTAGRTNLYEYARELKRIVVYHLVMKAQVVLGTNTSIGELRGPSENLNLSNAIVFLDEAGQAAETSAMIPLTMGAEWVMMAADLQQLRPTIKTGTAQEKLGFNVWEGSIYGRLKKQLGLPEFMLTVQYRMHSAIREFPSIHFYRNQLTDSPTISLDTRVPVPWHKGSPLQDWWPFQKFGGRGETPVAFFDVRGEDRIGTDYEHTNLEVDFAASRTSHWNNEEASAALRLALLMGSDPSVKSILVVTMYKAQLNLLQAKLDASQAHMEDLRRQKLLFPSIKAFTVDGCQGKEADVVIVSTVRSNMHGRTIGHVADQRRLNVAITRAKRALLVVGNKASLKCVDKKTIDKGTGDVRSFWPDWLEWVESKGCLVSQDHTASYLDVDVKPPVTMDVKQGRSDKHRKKGRR